MEAQQFWHLSAMWTWIFVFFFSSVYSGKETPKISLESTVFVALAGDELNIHCKVRIPANESGGILTCSDPSPAQIYSCEIPATSDQPKDLYLTLNLKNLTSSGEYSCKYKTSEVYWFLRVRDYGYQELQNLDYTEVITVTVFTGLLLVFSVLGSVYVFRGHWKDHCRKQKQNRRKQEEKKKKETKEDDVDVTAPSTSFYASLEPRPRSIYDVLDRSAAGTESEQIKAKPKTKEPQTPMVQTKQPQHEDVFESVYENF
uniref:uncharacterized protein LOC124071454 isoform X3 n=1 Tax=Scatophagus argus TaxID=75038 RepID=UPI001ED86183|nr:uncharacterized protein LOC124071454 isoform X3 [Scatophagus argus]